jgi:Arc-like DNA binding dprotein
MVKRKRAPGGGMKPRGEFSGLTSVLSLRMPDDMRAQLESAAKKHRPTKRSLTQELLKRLERSFNEDREKSRDPALRALLYLIGEVAEGVTNPAPVRLKNTRPLWHSDPFLFRAFRIAVDKLLDEFEPPGEIKPPPGFVEPADGFEIFTASKYMRDIYQSPKTLGGFVAAGIMRALYSPAPADNLADWPRPRWDDYGMQSASRDLGLKPKGRKS